MVVVGVPPLEFWVLAVLQDVLLALEVRVVVADPCSALHTDRVHPEETKTGSRCYPAEVLSHMLKRSAGLTGQNFFILRPSIICAAQTQSWSSGDDQLKETGSTYTKSSSLS